MNRSELVGRLHFVNACERADLLDPAKTHDNLIALLAVVVAQGYEPLITSVRTDHSDDSALGPHGHSAGYAVDFWVSPEHGPALIADLCANNHYCTKVGLGGAAQNWHGVGVFNNTVVFTDNESSHVHAQSAD